MTLNDIALTYDTDKSSKLHHYTKRYAQYFDPLRDQPLKILEIGIQNGYSLKTWKEYFPSAHIYGIDIVDCSHMDEERITTIKGSQNDLFFLKEIVEKYGPFDIIIDDGSHYSTDMKISFDFLFPTLQPGGLYVVEDLHCVYWPEFSDGGHAFMNRLKELTDSVNGHGKWGLAEITNSADDHVYQGKKFGTPDWWDHNVEYIHLYRSIVFIKKYDSGAIYPSTPRHLIRWYAQVWRFVGKVWRTLARSIKKS
jgi:hypothetical protein